MASANRSSVAILDRVIGSHSAQLSPEAARYFLSLDFTAEDRDRINMLAAKNRKGQATREELDEIEDYLRVGHFLTLMHSRARRVLKVAPADSSVREARH